MCQNSSFMQSVARSNIFCRKVLSRGIGAKNNVSQCFQRSVCICYCKCRFTDAFKKNRRFQIGESKSVVIAKENYLGNTQTYETSGYSATISDVRLFSTFTGIGINTPAATAANAAVTSTTTLGTNVSTTVIGSQINLRATTVNTLFGNNTQLQATLTVEGRDSGARLTIPVTVTKVS